jgi:hypothetical protein
LIDRGEPALNVPACRGGLFVTSPDGSDRFLVQHKVPDFYLALAIDLLARDRDETTPGLAFIDYGSLAVRHLGAIHERLLECKLRRAGRNEFRLCKDRSGRRASGSYYTPDPIVEYIIAGTVGPVLDEKLAALRREFRKGRRDSELVEHFFDLRVLDPAMGSGHFLVAAVDFITDRLLKFLTEFPINPVHIALDRTRTSILASLRAQGVSVDPARLTDINLLKRHVLKRCIYGVDLDPMAVELARVSLWLDAFALGDPLNFLDHHLRCGNSLLGATFEDLERARIPFSIHRERVPVVSKTAGASEAREILSGYRVVFDCLVAAHFGLPQALTEIIEASLAGETQRRLVDQVEALAQQADRRFFHWEIEFPEVFFDFVEGERQLKHKDRIKEGSAGFDCVVGNPPYVRQEALRPLKAFLQASYQTHNRTNDVYVYFQELAIRNLRAGGRMGMIVANKWLRAGYGGKLRRFLRRVGRPLEVIDFGHSPIFPEIDTFPCILIVQKRPAPPATFEDEQMDVCQVPREHWHETMDLGAFVVGHRRQVPLRLLQNEGWSLEDPRVLRLLEKIRTTGTPLKEYCAAPIYGIKTGCNDAFVIDERTRTRLLNEHHASGDLIRPLLRGRDIDRWRPRASGLYLIAARRGTTIDAYPAIKRHLQQFRTLLEPEPCDWADGRGQWPGRARGDYQWFELQASPGEETFEALRQPKIVYQEIQFHSWFSLDTSSSVVNNKVFFLPTNDLALLGVLCSPLQWWHLTRVLPHMKDETLSPAAFLMKDLCIPLERTSQTESIRAAVVPLLAHAGQVHEWEHETAAEARRIFSLPAEDAQIIAWLALSPAAFANRLLKQAGARRPTAKLTEALFAFHQKQRARQVELLTRQLALERSLAVLVEDAYGLDWQERALLRSTRPVRDPLDVLEAKIRAGEAVAADSGE